MVEILAGFSDRPRKTSGSGGQLRTTLLACGPGERKRVGKPMWSSIGGAQATHLSDLLWQESGALTRSVLNKEREGP